MRRRGLDDVAEPAPLRRRELVEPGGLERPKPHPDGLEHPTRDDRCRVNPQVPAYRWMPDPGPGQHAGRAQRPGGDDDLRRANQELHQTDGGPGRRLDAGGAATLDEDPVAARIGDDPGTMRLRRGEVGTNPGGLRAPRATERAGATVGAVARIALDG